MIGNGADIILEVAQARNPARYAQAIKKLSDGAAPNLSKIADAGLGGATFGRTFQSASVLGVNPLGFSLHGVNGANTPNQGQQTSGSSAVRWKTDEAFRQLEQLTLQKTLEVMIPDSMTGGKTNSASNQFWKSKLAEVLAKSISDSNQVGIAASLQSAFARSHSQGTS